VHVPDDTTSDAPDAKSDTPADVRDSAGPEVISRGAASADGPMDKNDVAGTCVDQAREGEGGDAFICRRTLAAEGLPTEPMGQHPMVIGARGFES
jgi:hypothetical protein